MLNDNLITDYILKHKDTFSEKVILDRLEKDGINKDKSQFLYNKVFNRNVVEKDYFDKNLEKEIFDPINLYDKSKNEESLEKLNNLIIKFRKISPKMRKYGIVFLTSIVVGFIFFYFVPYSYFSLIVTGVCIILGLVSIFKLSKFNVNFKRVDINKLIYLAYSLKKNFLFNHCEKNLVDFNKEVQAEKDPDKKNIKEYFKKLFDKEKNNGRIQYQIIGNFEDVNFFLIALKYTGRTYRKNGRSSTYEYDKTFLVSKADKNLGSFRIEKKDFLNNVFDTLSGEDKKVKSGNESFDKNFSIIFDDVNTINSKETLSNFTNDICGKFLELYKEEKFIFYVKENILIFEFKDYFLKTTGFNYKKKLLCKDKDIENLDKNISKFLDVCKKII